MMTNTHEQDHRAAVIALLDLDPLSADAAKLRVEIDLLERSDTTLIAQRIALFAANARPIGAVPQAEPAGVMLT